MENPGVPVWEYMGVPVWEYMGWDSSLIRYFGLVKVANDLKQPISNTL